MQGIYSPRYVGPSRNKRSVRNRGVDCVSGEYPSGKPATGFRMVRYDGMLARAFIIVLEDDASVVSYSERPDSFRWSDGATWRRFVPAFSVEMDDGRRIAVRLGRRGSRIEDAGFLPAIRRAASTLGYHDVEIWTADEVVRQPGLVNGALLGSERTFVTDAAVTDAMRLTMRACGGRATVDQLRRRSGLGNRAYRAVVRLVALGEFRMASTTDPLDDHAVVEGA